MCGGFFCDDRKLLNKEQVEFVRKAYDVAAEAHASQRRKSGRALYHSSAWGSYDLIAAPAGRTDLGGSLFCMMWWKILISAWIP